MTINTFQPLSDMKTTEKNEPRSRKKIIKANSARINGKVHLNMGDAAKHEPWFEMVSEGDTVTGAVIHCTCGSAIEIQFEYEKQE